MKRFLDRQLGRVTMYRLMVIVLLAIAFIALVLSLIPNGLSFSFVQLTATLLVSVVVTSATSWAFAYLFRTRPHPESALISGLLIFFLFFPTTTPLNLLWIALVCVIASASKYLLAWRRRHIFNPVAIAALIIAFTQLSAAVWWVGTPYLLIPVIIGGFLVVYRTRRFGLVGVFIVLALAISITRLTLGGATPWQAITLSIGSAPIIFFAVFMLDEPLTLPPLRWQQLSLAALVAVIVEIPFHFGPFYNSPELGLVVMNLIAFFLGQRKTITLDYVGSTALTPTVNEVTFRPEHPVRFTPGQYMELTLPHGKSDARGIRRVFSVASAPGSGDVSFGMSFADKGSSFKRALAGLEPGARIRATSVGGDFTLPRDLAVPVLLVAGGIGITPFVSQLRHHTDQDHERDIVVVYAIRSDSELAYLDELKESGAHVVVVAPTKPAGLPESWAFIEGDRLDAGRLEEVVPSLSDRVAYVSGPPVMVNALRKDLRVLGVRRVRADYFSGY